MTYIDVPLPCQGFPWLLTVHDDESLSDDRITGYSQSATAKLAGMLADDFTRDQSGFVKIRRQEG